MKRSLLPACLYLLCLQLLQSCINPHYSLNKAEKAYIENHPKYETASILYDNAAIRQLKDDGVYTVGFEMRRLYPQDTMVLKVNAISVASEVSKIMNFKDHFKYIDVDFHGVSNGAQTNGIGEAAENRYVIRIPINNISKAFVRVHLDTNF